MSRPATLRLAALGVGAVLAAGSLPAGAAGAAAAAPQRVTVTGEVIDTWCYVTEIMFATGLRQS